MKLGQLLYGIDVNCYNSVNIELFRQRHCIPYIRTRRPKLEFLKCYFDTISWSYSPSCLIRPDYLGNALYFKMLDGMYLYDIKNCARHVIIWSFTDGYNLIRDNVCKRIASGDYIPEDSYLHPKQLAHLGAWFCNEPEAFFNQPMIKRELARIMGACDYKDYFEFDFGYRRGVPVSIIKGLTRFNPNTYRKVKEQSVGFVPGGQYNGYTTGILRGVKLKHFEE